MNNFTGFATAALQLGLESILIRPKRGIYNATLTDGTTLADILAQATIEEDHHDELDISEHPVEQGAAITDHAFKRPAEVRVKLGWSNSPSGEGSLINAGVAAVSSVSPGARRLINGLEIIGAVASTVSGSGEDQVNAVYQRLLELQATRAIFDLYTGKRLYKNMLCKSLVVQNDFKTEHSLFVTMTCRQVILVNTETVSLPKSSQANASATASTVDKGTKSLQPVTSSNAVGGNLPPGGFH